MDVTMFRRWKAGREHFSTTIIYTESNCYSTSLKICALELKSQTSYKTQAEFGRQFLRALGIFKMI